MDHSNSVSQWLSGLKKGDQEAATQLWHRYFLCVREVAQELLGPIARRIADDEDIAVDVLGRLFRLAARGEFEALSNREELWVLLLTLTHRRVIDVARAESRLKKGGKRVYDEQQLSDAARGGTALDGLPARWPTPLMEAIVNDELQRLLSLLPTAGQRTAVILRLEGYTNAEIAAIVRRTERTVERWQDQVRATWSLQLEK